MTEIKTWHERAMEHPDHKAGMVSEVMIRARMCEEAGELRAEIERLRARVAVLHDALSGLQIWMGAAIQCPAFQWDADQKQAGQCDLDDARAALEAKP